MSDKKVSTRCFSSLEIELGSKVEKVIYEHFKGLHGYLIPEPIHADIDCKLDELEMCLAGVLEDLEKGVEIHHHELVGSILHCHCEAVEILKMFREADDERDRRLS